MVTKKVDSSQGGERQLVISSAVRTKLAGPGFQTRPDRKVVSVSRAMNAFFIVGDLLMFESCYKHCPQWMKTIEALRNYSPAQANKFQVDVPGGIDYWCVDGEKLDFKMVPANFVESMELPVAKDVVDDDDDDDDEEDMEEDGMPLAEMDAEIEVEAEGEVLVDDDAEQMAVWRGYQEDAKKWLNTSGNISLSQRLRAFVLRDSLARTVREEKAGNFIAAEVTEGLVNVAIAHGLSAVVAIWIDGLDNPGW